MKLLAIDSSGPVCGVAVLDGDTVKSEWTAQNRLTHSVNLMPMVDAALNAAGLTLPKLDALACVVGPGSFTGVRIGVSTVKGLAHGAGKPCIPVNALEAMASGAGAFDGVVCPIQDARAGQVYGAAFRCDGALPQRLLPDQPMALEDWVNVLRGQGERFLFLGDGMPVHRERLSRMLGEAACFAAPQLSYLRPSAAAWLAASRPETAVDYLTLMPLYLRAPSAERNRKLVEAANNGQL